MQGPPGTRPRRRRTSVAPASGPHAAGARAAPAEALALRRRLRAGPDAVRGRRAVARDAASAGGRWRCPTDRCTRARAGVRRALRRRPAVARVRRPRADEGAAASRCLSRTGGGFWTRKQARRAGARHGARGRDGVRLTARSASSTTPPATTRATPPGAGRRGSAARPTAARWPGTWSTACTTARRSERTVWIDGEPREVAPQEFAADLSRCRRAALPRVVRAGGHTGTCCVMRNRYRQPFG